MPTRTSDLTAGQKALMLDEQICLKKDREDADVFFTEIVGNE